MRLAARATTALALALALLLPATAAQAAVVTVFSDSGELRVEADPGETNDLLVYPEPTQPDTYAIVDRNHDLTINGGSTFACSFPADPDRHTVWCAKPAGKPFKIQALYADDGDDTVSVSNMPVQDMSGGSGDDTLSGGSLRDVINGEAGDDTVTGNLGEDKLYGGADDDRIEARDDTADELIACGAGNDTAVVDPGDSKVNDCETVDRARGGGSDDPGGGGGDGTGGDSGPTYLSSRKTIRVPDGAPVRRKKSWRFTRYEDLRRDLRKLGVPVIVRLRKVGFAKVPRPYRAQIEDGDVFRQGGEPEPGSRVEVDAACPSGDRTDCPLRPRVSIYDESKDLGRGCPYDADKAETRDFLRLLRDRTYAEATRLLDEKRCDYRVVRWVEDKRFTELNVRGAQVSRNRKGARRFFIALVVDRPRRSDFTLSITGRPRSDYDQNRGRRGDFDREIDLGTDGKLTAGRAPGVITVGVNENWTARFVRELAIEVVKEDGRVLASSKTRRSGAVTFTLPLDWTGELEVNARLTLADGQEMAGWVTIPVVDRKRKAFHTQTGRYFRFKKDRYVLALSPTERSAAMAKLAEMLKRMARGFGAKGRDCQAALGSNAPPQDQVRTCWEQSGVQPTQFSSGGRTDGSHDFAKLENLPGAIVRDGKLASATLTSVVIPGTGAVTGASLIGNDGGSLMPHPSTLIGQDGGSLIGQDGGSLIGQDGGSLIANAGSKAIGFLAGQRLISDNGSGLISENGLGVISDNGLGLISDKGAGALPVFGRFN